MFHNRSPRACPIVLVVVAETGSAAETEALGAQLAAALHAGDVVSVAGELGAGKTTFVRGACRALGVEQPVSSPTFTIGHRYAARIPVAHLDLYRVRGLGAEDWGDLEPYFDGTIAFVEWPEHAGAWLPPVRAAVTLAHVDESHRRVTIEPTDDLVL
jgi:tRNA threonylcarbamoyladenosine biosynthesis protein TsaE